MSDDKHADLTAYTPAIGRAAGGAARAKALSRGRRSDIAKKAAAARWAETHQVICGSPDNPLKIGDVEIECYVLDDGTRVLTQGGFLQAFGRARTVRRTNEAPPFIQGKALAPYLSKELLERAQPIPFQRPGSGRAYGYHAELLPDVCEAFLAARADGALPQNQWRIADQAELLVRGLARVGITALVDEATGYQDVRTKDALAKILEEFIDRELQPYLATFPVDFYKELFRLRGLPWKATSARPQYFGKLTNDIVYRRLAPGVLEELKRVQAKSPSGRPKHKLFQRLTENLGYPKLHAHLGSVVTLMKLSDDYDDFKAKLERLHPIQDGQGYLPIDVKG